MQVHSRNHGFDTPYHSGNISPEPKDRHPVIFDSIDENAIRSTTLRVTGSTGPSGMDAHG